MMRYKKRYRKIPQYPARILSTRCKEWTDFSPKGQEKLEKMAADMFRVLHSQKWGSKLGIAANQAGYKWRVAIILGRFVVNPEFRPTNAPKDLSIEGCYSLGMDNIYRIPRAPYGWAKWQDTQGEWHEEKVRGVLNIVFQHELDHLDGKTCHDGGEKVEPPKEITSNK